MEGFCSGTGTLPAAGSVACGGLWVMAAADSRSSAAVISVAAHMAIVFARNQSWSFFLVARRGEGRACGVWWPMYGL